MLSPVPSLSNGRKSKPHRRSVNGLGTASNFDFALGTSTTLQQADAQMLGDRLIARLPGSMSYQAHLLDSGVEALELAIGHAYMVHLEALRKVYDEIRTIVSDLWLQAATGDVIEIPSGKTLAGYLDDLEQRNLGALESFQRHPVMLAFQAETPVVGGGALGPRLRNACRNACDGVIEPRVVNLERRGGGIEEALSVHRCHFRVPRLENGKVVVDVRTEPLVFACVVGPSETGDGICSLAQDSASSLVFRPKGLPLVIEESRVGCPGAEGLYAFARTALSQARPEYVVLSKVMAGWGSKIGAAMVRSDVLRVEYALDSDQTCTDGFSLGVALSVLDALESV